MRGDVEDTLALYLYLNMYIYLYTYIDLDIYIYCIYIYVNFVRSTQLLFYVEKTTFLVGFHV